MRIIKDKYISPFTYFGFKKLFGTEPNKDLLIDFLNELLQTETGRIINLNYLPLEQLGQNEDARKAIFDIYCESETGENLLLNCKKPNKIILKTVVFITQLSQSNNKQK